MSESIRFRSEAEAQAWDGYAAALRSGDYRTFADLASDADALLAERRKREGVEESERAAVADALYAVAVALHAARDMTPGWRDVVDGALTTVEALVAAARGTK